MARTPSQEILRHFRWQHLPPHLQAVSREIGEVAHEMEDLLPDGPEKTMGLRKLLEAKDCFVRAALPDDPEPLIEVLRDLPLD
jgi:hypothetical protein